MAAECPRSEGRAAGCQRAGTSSCAPFATKVRRVQTRERGRKENRVLNRGNAGFMSALCREGEAVGFARGERNLVKPRVGGTSPDAKRASLLVIESRAARAPVSDSARPTEGKERRFLRVRASLFDELSSKPNGKPTIFGPVKQLKNETTARNVCCS